MTCWNQFCFVIIVTVYNFPRILTYFIYPLFHISFISFCDPYVTIFKQIQDLCGRKK
jgi:hypothetical protein